MDEGINNDPKLKVELPLQQKNEEFVKRVGDLAQEAGIDSILLIISTKYEYQHNDHKDNASAMTGLIRGNRLEVTDMVSEAIKEDRNLKAIFAAALIFNLDSKL